MAGGKRVAYEELYEALRLCSVIVYSNAVSGPFLTTNHLRVNHGVYFRVSCVMCWEAGVPGAMGSTDEESVPGREGSTHQWRIRGRAACAPSDATGFLLTVEATAHGLERRGHGIC